LKRFFGSIAIAACLLYGFGCGDGLPPLDRNGAISSAAPEKPDLGPAPASPATPQPVAFKSEMDTVAATVEGEPVTMRQVVEPLIKTHGLTTLLSLVEVETARQDAIKAKVTVTPQDFKDEYKIQIDKLLKDSDDTTLLDAIDKAVKEKRDSDAEFLRNEIKLQREELLDQVLANKHMTRDEFDTWLRLNTYLRKVALPQIEAKITEDALKKAFGVMYGERIKVKYIELATMDEVTVAKRRLAAGEPFESVAHDMSYDERTKGLGGELRTFTRANTNVPDAFKEAAFALKDGQISEVVVIGNWKDVIKRIELIPPEHVKFETVKPDVYRALHDSLLEAAIQSFRRQLAAQVRLKLKILDPALLKQFDDQIAGSANASKKAADDLARKQRLDAILKPPATTRPATQPINETNPTTTSVATPGK
jgi:parvulin-like peptidyl-prolyl isomerase